PLSGQTVDASTLACSLAPVAPARSGMRLSPASGHSFCKKPPPKHNFGDLLDESILRSYDDAGRIHPLPPGVERCYDAAPFEAFEICCRRRGSVGRLSTPAGCGSSRWKIGGYSRSQSTR